MIKSQSFNFCADLLKAMYPANKLDKKLGKFLTSLVTKRIDDERFFEYCFNEIVKNDNPKVLSNHGLKIFIQLFLKHNQSILMANLKKVC